MKKMMTLSFKPPKWVYYRGCSGFSLLVYTLDPCGSSFRIGSLVGRSQDTQEITSGSGGSQVGDKRLRNSEEASSALRRQRSRFSMAMYKYGQSLRNQGDILKVLAHKVIFSFTEAQKQQPLIICCPNGLLDLVTGQLKGKQSPDDCVTEVCGTEFDLNADMQPAIDFYKQMLYLEAYPEQQKIVEFIQMLMGYCLTRETDQQYCLIFYGRRSN
jgi:phage/plasmid-associated DNA primase